MKYLTKNQNGVWFVRHEPGRGILFILYSTIGLEEDSPCRSFIPDRKVCKLYQWDKKHGLPCKIQTQNVAYKLPLPVLCFHKVLY
jgi:hypothetical protein